MESCKFPDCLDDQAFRRMCLRYVDESTMVKDACKCVGLLLRYITGTTAARNDGRYSFNL